MRAPVACTLNSGDARERIEEWRRFMSQSTDQAVRVTDEQLRLRLVASPDVVPVAIDLAQREKACCGFFEFSISVESDACWLVIAVPSDAVGVLGDLIGLLPAR